MNEELRQRCERVVTSRVTVLRNKFDPSRYVHRREVENAVRQFLSSDRSLFILLAGSGKGKTNFVCQFAIESAKNRPTLFATAASAFDDGGDAWSHIIEPLWAELGGEMEREAWWSRTLHELDRSGELLVVCIDAINEVRSPEKAAASLRSLVSRSPANVKFVVTCRTDAFRAHFNDPLWSDYLFVSDIAPQPADLPVVAGRVSAEQLEAMRQALAAQHAQLIRRQTGLREQQGLLASAILSSFDEVELAAAEETYATTADLVGEARESCHDPLVFRFFADTVGRSAREVSEVFIVSNCRGYLNRVVTEAMARCPAQTRRSVLLAIHSLAEHVYARRSGRSSDDRLLPDDVDPLLADALIDSGIVFWEGQTANGLPRSLNFTFDRMLSFVRADAHASAPRNDAIVARLIELRERRDLPEIDAHEAVYLLLMLDETADSGAPEWAGSLLKKTDLAARILEALPLMSAGAEKAIETIVDTIRDCDHEQLIVAAASALTMMAAEHPQLVISAVEELMTARASSEAERHLNPMLRPLAAAFDGTNGRALPLILWLNGPERYSYKHFYPQLPDGPRLRSSGEEKEAWLRSELKKFPRARIRLLRALSNCRETHLRVAVADALPNLIVQRRKAGSMLTEKLANDSHSSVRAAVCDVVPALYGIDRDEALTFLRRAAGDRDSAVRAAAAEAALQLFVDGESEATTIIAEMLGDPSVVVRVGVAIAAGKRWAEMPASEHEPLEWIVRALTRDPSDAVRESVVAASAAPIAKYLRICEETLGDRPGRRLEAAIMESITTILPRLSSSDEECGALIRSLLERIIHERTSGIRELLADTLVELDRSGKVDVAPLIATLFQRADYWTRMRLIKADQEQPLRGMPEGIIGEAATEGRKSERSFEALEGSVLIRHIRGSERLHWFLEVLTAFTAVIVPLTYALSVILARSKLLMSSNPAERFDPRQSLIPAAVGALAALETASLLPRLTFLFRTDLHKARIAATIAGRFLGYALRFALFLTPVWFITHDANITATFFFVVMALIAFDNCRRSEKEVYVRPPLDEPVTYSTAGPYLVAAAGVVVGLVSGWLATQLHHDLFFLLCGPLVIGVVSIGLSVHDRNAIGEAAGNGLWAGTTLIVAQWVVQRINGIPHDVSALLGAEVATNIAIAVIGLTIYIALQSYRTLDRWDHYDTVFACMAMIALMFVLPGFTPLNMLQSAVVSGTAIGTIVWIRRVVKKDLGRFWEKRPYLERWIPLYVVAAIVVLMKPVAGPFAGIVFGALAGVHGLLTADDNTRVSYRTRTALRRAAEITFARIMPVYIVAICSAAIIHATRLLPFDELTIRAAAAILAGMLIMTWRAKRRLGDRATNYLLLGIVSSLTPIALLKKHRPTAAVVAVVTLIITFWAVRLFEALRDRTVRNEMLSIPMIATLAIIVGSLTGAVIAHLMLFALSALVTYAGEMTMDATVVPESESP